jgi:hypothetical protein
MQVVRIELAYFCRPLPILDGEFAILNAQGEFPRPLVHCN